MKANGLLFVALTLTACGGEGTVFHPASAATFGLASVSIPSRTDLGTLGGPSSYATDINDAGTVVGYSNTASGNDHAFRWTASTGMVDLGTLPGAAWSRAVSITATGQILGQSGTGFERPTPVIWSPTGEITSLPISTLTGATFTAPTDMNTRGEVIGWGDAGISHAWIWSRSRGLLDLDTQFHGFETYPSRINASSVVVGTNNNCEVGCLYHAFIWSRAAGYRDLGIAGEDIHHAVVFGSDITEQGVVAGSIGLHDDSSIQPYLWSSTEGFTLLPTFDTATWLYGYAESVNSAGISVGASYDPQYDAIQAAAWTAGGILKLSPGDPNPGVAIGINYLGMIAGWVSLDGGHGLNHAVVWQAGAGSRAGSTPVTAVGAPSGNGSARPGIRTAGPASCLANPRAVMSRGALINCMVQKG